MAGKRIYGAVSQMEKDVFVTYESHRVPKIWSEEKNDIKMIRLSARMLPVPYDVQSWVVANIK